MERFKFILSIYVISLLLPTLICYSQCAQPIFSIPSDICLNEQLNIVNESTGLLDQFEWDFCDGDLLTVPNGNQLSQITQVTGLTGIQLASDNNNHYIFLTGRTGNHIVRLDLGNNLSNPTPSVVNLGTLGGILNGPVGIKIVKEDDNWYGLVYNSGNDILVRISFGTSLANNSPTAQNVVKAYGGVNNGLDLATINGKTIAAITNPTTNKVTLIDFGNSINNTPADPTNILTTNALPGASLLRGINLVQVCNNWYGFVVTSGNRKIYRLDFGNNLFSIPSIVDITGTFPGTENFVDIKVFYEAGNYIGFILTTQGVLYKLNFGTSIVNLPEKVSLGNLGVIANTLYFDFVTKNSSHYMFTGNTSTRFIYRGDFQDNCSSSIPISNEFAPQGVKYTSYGNYLITLKSINSSGVENHLTKSITIQDLQAPNISVSSEGMCKLNSVQFTSDSDLPLTSVLWDFGDGTTSAIADPNHTYSNSEEYLIQFNVTAQNGCNNYTSKQLKIYDEPVPGFMAPSGTICTNNEYLFSNTTLDNFDGNLGYQWLEADQMVGTDRDLNYEFLSASSKQIKLITSIPGCSSEIVRTIPSVMEGPEVDFLVNGQCQLEEISFEDDSQGDVVSLSWDFGNGQTSSQTDPTIVYQSTGNFQVELQINSSNGCQNTTTKLVPIYSLPQPNFQLELPPFSCSGIPSQFTDLTPNPTDSNITSWEWNFGDSNGQNSSTLKNPTHIYSLAGQYHAKLIAETNFGCKDSLSKVVTIVQTPEVTITNTPSCDDVPITFSTSAQNDIANWNWQIGNAQFTIPEPTYVFNNPGNYTASLNAVGKNNCIATANKTIVVPLSLVPNFIVDKNCTGQQTLFTDATTVYDDPIKTYEWNFGDAGAGTNSPAVHTYTTTGSYNVSLKTTTESGCIYSNLKTISVGNPPQAFFTAAPEVGVPPLTVSFLNQSVSATQYQWNFNDVNNSTSTAVSPQFTFQDYGDYIVDLTAFNAQNCSHTFSKVIKAQLPLIDVGLENFSISETANGLLTGQVVIHNKGNFTLNNLELTTDLSGIVIHQTVNTPIPPFSSILYSLDFKVSKNSLLKYVCLEAKLNGDVNLDDNSICTSIEGGVVIFSPYPNPSSGLINVEWISPEDQIAKVYVVDAVGKLVFENEVSSIKGLNTVLLNLETLPQGVYVMSFRSAQSASTFRFVIQH